MRVFSFFIFSFVVFAQEDRNVVDCNIIFEQRKDEILKELEKIDEQQQALQALQSATQSVLDQKDADLKKREAEVSNQKKEIEEKEQRIASLLKKNEEILKQIQNAIGSKLNDTYSSMKDSKSAAILENLPESEAAQILFGLDTKVMSKILSKMNPQKAATLTQIIQKGPPFDKKEE